MNFDPSKHKIVAVVTEKGPEQGQHFHLSLPDLAREVHETTVIKEVQRDDGVIAELQRQIAEIREKPSTIIQEAPAELDGVKVQLASTTEHHDKLAREVATLKAMFSDLVDDVAGIKAAGPAREVVKVEATQVEKLPQQYVDRLEVIARDLAKFKDSQEFVLPRAFQEITERVERLENPPQPLRTVDDGEDEFAKITKETWSEMVSDFALSLQSAAVATNTKKVLAGQIGTLKARVSYLENRLDALEDEQIRRRTA